MKIKLSRFVNDYECGPDDCMGCKDEMNGINYGKLYIGSTEFRFNLCDKCLRKLRKKMR